MEEQSTSKGFAILSTAALAVKLLSVIYMPFLINIIGGNRPYAIYSVTYQIYAFIYVLTNTGVPSAISKLVSEFVAVGNYKSALKTFKVSRLLLFVVGLVMAHMMFFVSGPLTTHMNFGEAKYSVIALCPAIVFTSVASAYRGYFQGTNNMRPTAISQVLEQIFNTVFSLLFAAILISHGIEAGCVGATIGTTLGALVSASYLIITFEKNKHFKINILHNNKLIGHTNKQVLKRILKYSIPITMCIGITNAGTLIDSYNITSRLIAGGSLKVFAQNIFGMYAKYSTLINVPITIISALGMAVLPAISRAVALNDKKLTTNKINFAFKVNFLIAIPSAVGFSVLAKPIYELLHLGDGYKIMIFGSVIVIFMALSLIQTSILQGIGKLYVVFFYSLIGLVVKYVTNYILVAIPSIGIYGAIIGSSLGFGVPIVLNIVYLQRTLKLKINLKPLIFKPLVASTFMAAVIYVIYNIISYILGFIIKGYFNNVISVILSIILGMLSYFYVMILINGITNDELDILPNSLRRFIPFKLTK